MGLQTDADGITDSGSSAARQIDRRLRRSVGAPNFPSVTDAFAEIAETLSFHSSLDELLEQLVSQVRALFGVERCSIFLHESHSGLFHGRAAVDAGDGGAAAVVKQIVCGMQADGFTLELVASRRPVLIKNARLDARPVRAAVQNLDLFEVLGVPLLAQGEAIGLIFLDDPGARHGFGEADERIATALGGIVGMAIRQLRGTEALRESAAKVARQNKFLQRGRAMQDRLTQLALESSSVQDIADAVATVTGEPCLIYDADMRRLGSGALAGSRDPVQSILDAGVGSSSEVAKTLAAVEDGGPAMVGPFPRAGLHRRAIVAPIRAREQNWGYVVVSESSRRLNSLDVGVAKQAASIVAVEFSASQRDAFLDVEARDALIRDLLNGSANSRGLRDRIAHHGFKLDERYAVVILSALEGAEVELNCPIVDAALSGTGLSGAPATTELEDGTIVSLVLLGADGPPPESARRVKEAIVSAIALLSPQGGIVGAVSSACLMPSECSLGFEEARRVLECISAVGLNTGSVLAADDLGVGRLLLGMANSPEAGRFADQTLGPMLDADSIRGGELLETLSAFVDCGRNVKHAALHLNVHENTIRYRLSRIADLTGLDAILNPDHQLSCQLAVMILRLQGRLTYADGDPVQGAIAGSAIA